MATSTHVVNITRKTVRIGTTTVPTLSAGIGPAAPSVTTIDLEALGHAGRQDLRSLLAQGSLLPSASATSTKVSYIALHGRNRARFGATNLPDLTLVTINPTTMKSWQRRDLIQLLASGSLLVGDTASTASVTLYNLTSKTLRFGSATIAPFRIAGANHATDVVTLTNGTTVSAGFKFTYGVTQGSTVFVNGTNMTAAAMQTALRTATSDAGLAVTGTTDAGPFTVTFTDGFTPSALTVTSGSKAETITLTSFSSTRSFKLTYNAIETAAFVRGTNAAASDLQTALRTATSDTGLLVSGTTDSGPYTVVYSAGFAPLSVLTVTSGTGGVTGVVAEIPLTGAVVATGSIPAAAQVTDVTAMTVAQRYDLQTLLASGQLLAKA